MLTPSPPHPRYWNPHSTLGGSPHDFYVTSTLASQTPPAVGRALGFSVAHMNKVDSIFPRDSVSFVSIGDGSSHNAHFLAAANLGDLAIAHKVLAAIHALYKRCTCAIHAL